MPGSNRGSHFSRNFRNGVVDFGVWCPALIEDTHFSRNFRHDVVDFGVWCPVYAITRQNEFSRSHRLLPWEIMSLPMAATKVSAKIRNLIPPTILSRRPACRPWIWPCPWPWTWPGHGTGHGHRWACPDMASNGWPWLAVSRHGRPWPAIAGHVLSWPGMTAGRPLRAVSRHGRPSLAMSRHGRWLAMLACHGPTTTAATHQVLTEVGLKTVF